MHRVRPAARTLLVALFTAVPWLDPFAGGPSPSVQPWLVSMACGVILWALAGAGTPDRRILFTALALAAWAAVQGALSPDVAFLAGGLLLIVLAAGMGQDEPTAAGVQAGVLCAAALSALMGLVQYFGASGAFLPWISAAPTGEAYGNLRQPNLYATLTWLGAAVLLWGRVRIPRGASLVLMVLLAAGSAASVSRTAVLQGLLLTGLAAWWGGPQRRERLVLCAGAAASYFLAAALLPLLLQSITGIVPERTLWGRIVGGEPCSSRMVLWSNVLHLIAQKPLAGWGWGQLDYAHYATLYEGPRFCNILDNAHNLPLHLAVELGVPAAVAACVLAIAWTWRQRPWREQVPLRQLAWAAIALILVHSMLEYPLWYGPFQLVFGACLGWLMPARVRRGTLVARLAPAAAVAVLVAATAYAAWDYERVSQIYLPPAQRRPAWREDTLAHIRKSWLFAGQARFAALTLTTVSRDNAAQVYGLAEAVLHYSPEPPVIERVIESATLLGKDREAVLHLARFRAAFPREYEAWREERATAGRAPQ